MSKNRFTRILVVLAAVILIIAVSIPQILAEDDKNMLPEHLLTLDLELHDNLLFANYGLTIYLDDTELVHLPQGGRVIKTATVPEGMHTLTFCPDNSSSSTVLTIELSVTDDMLVESTLQAHRKYVKVNSLSYRHSDGSTQVFRNLTDNTLREFLSDTIARIAVYGTVEVK